MSTKIKLSKKERADLIKWVKEVYAEVEDIEFPEVLLNEVFHRGYVKGLSVNDKGCKKVARESLSRIKSSITQNLRRTFEEEMKRIEKEITYLD